jgi:hypothetical protein
MLVLEFEVSSTIISKVILEHHKQIIKLGWEHKVIVSNEKLQKFLQSNGIDVISLIDLSKEYNIDENIEMKSFRNYRNLIIPEALYQARNISNFNENKYIKNYLKTEYLIRKIYEKEKPLTARADVKGGDKTLIEADGGFDLSKDEADKTEEVISFSLNCSVRYIYLLESPISSTAETAYDLLLLELANL